MKTHFSKAEISYTGDQLASHYAYRQFKLLGDSCVGFIGACQVGLPKMVDLEDVLENAPIYSPKMLHFILETFHLDLKAAVFLQRLGIVIMEETLRSYGVRKLTRHGDDLFINKKKLSVSIATSSPVSSLIHWGLNLQTKGTPIPTAGLDENGINGIEFGERVLENIRAEYQSALNATYKVKAVD